MEAAARWAQLGPQGFSPDPEGGANGRGPRILHALFTLFTSAGKGEERRGETREGAGSRREGAGPHYRRGAREGNFGKEDKVAKRLGSWGVRRGAWHTGGCQ